MDYFLFGLIDQEYSNSRQVKKKIANKTRKTGTAENPARQQTILGGIQIYIKYYRYGKYTNNLQICTQDMV